jgi:hypothetical protein
MTARKTRATAAVERGPEKRRPLTLIEAAWTGGVDNDLAYVKVCLRDALMRGESPLSLNLIRAAAARIAGT